MNNTVESKDYRVGFRNIFIQKERDGVEESAEEKRTIDNVSKEPMNII